VRRGAGRLLSLLPDAALVVVVGYLSLVTVSATRAVAAGATRTAVDAPPRRRFAVLVPAHDEARSIARTLQTLTDVQYPDGLIDVHVVADNCTDDTAAVVRSCGFEAHERDDATHPGKGPALQWLLGRLAARGERYDAFLLVDADTDVDPRFLVVADALLGQGATVVQGFYGVRDPGASPTVAFRAAALAARHYLRPLGRNHLGASAGLYGNGMVFRSEVLDAHSWSGHLTEDLEMQLALLRDGTTVTFAPDAVVVAEMPTTPAAARTQQQRWERGRVDIAKRAVPGLIRRAVRGGPAGRVAYADAALDQLVPPLSVLATGSAAFALMRLAIAQWRPGRANRWRAAIALTMVGLQPVHVLAALWMVGAPRAVYAGLLRAPQLAVWKVGIWLDVVARGHDGRWIRTARNDEPVSRP
jgi:hypothetical protein